jgi:hypothetical protein
VIGDAGLPAVALAGVADVRAYFAEQLQERRRSTMGLPHRALGERGVDGNLMSVEEAGDGTVVFPGSANRDELVWERSEELDLERTPIRTVAFGDGIHFCIGSHLARLEARVGPGALLARIPDHEACGPIKRSERVNERGITALPVRF